MASPNIDYTTRDFASVRQQLQNYAVSYYPETFQDYSNNSIESLLLDLMSGSIDLLSYNTDNNFNETQLTYAQQSVRY